KGVVAPAALEPGKPRFLAVQETTEERLVGAVKPSEHVLEEMRMDGGILWEGGPQVLELGFLLETGGCSALPAPPPSEALLQRRVVKGAAAPQDLLQRPLLGRRQLEFVLERFAHGGGGLHAGCVGDGLLHRLHRPSFCLIDARRQAAELSAKALSSVMIPCGEVRAGDQYSSASLTVKGVYLLCPIHLLSPVLPPSSSWPG